MRSIRATLNVDYLVFESDDQKRGVFFGNRFIYGWIIFIIVVELKLCSSEQTFQITSNELNALIDFYEATNGDNWKGCECKGTGNVFAGGCPWNISLWKNGPEYFECINEGAWCGMMVQPIPGSCHIRSLVFQEGIALIQISNLNGTLPSSFSNLIHLKQLIVTQQPHLYGILPSNLFKSMTLLNQ
eukprot:406832_1